jgi:hypothetical protein
LILCARNRQTPIPIVERYVRDYLLKRFGENIIRWKCLKGNGGDDETRTRDLCVTVDAETQALTGSIEKRKVLKRRRREFLLFPDCFRVGSETKSADGLAADAK